ncbi:MAG: acyl-CoA dehydrogenase [Actinomycetia bacterium]|nr:acyl-CoA dehydrogenase [Actinomycetes bacterium]
MAETGEQDERARRNRRSRLDRTRRDRPADLPRHRGRQRPQPGPTGPIVKLEDFAAESEEWLASHAELKPQRGRFHWGDGDDGIVEIWSEHDPTVDAEHLRSSRAWRQLRFDAGYGWIDGPLELGGRGLTPSHARAFARLESRYDVPPQDWFKLGPVIGPILMAHASEELQERYVPGLHRGDLVACELFSEPGAGSDLSSASCSAVAAGNDWVLDGQKVWTSDAHIADIGLVLARTDRELSANRGLTTFLIDMTDPAVEVRPLRQMTGGSAFNEVFITDLRVPDGHRVGAVNGGWAVAVHTLMFERQLVAAGHGRGGVGIANGDRLTELVRHFGGGDDTVIRQRLARVIGDFRVAGYLNQRRDLPSDALIMAKLSLARNLTSAAGLVAEVLGPPITADTGEWGTFAWTKFLLGAPGNHIAVGTDETIKNIIGERILGLPREPRPAAETP